MEATDEPAKAATIYDVADAAGVSHQTVSRYLTGYEGIRPETRERVVEALTRLGYRPNLAARALKSGRSRRIGALTHNLALVGPSRVAEAASAAARDAGYVLDLVSLDVHDPIAIQQSLDLIAPHALAGVVALSNTDEMTRAFALTRTAAPFVIAAEPDESDDDLSDLSRLGIPALIAHLADLGHRRVIHIAGPEQWSASRNRRRAVEAALRTHGMSTAVHLSGDWSAASGHSAIAALEALPDATAVIAANDQMALGAMLALKQRGVAVPSDMSVVGIDDVPESAFYDPPLTTLRVDFAARGRSSVATLLGMIDGVAPRPVHADPPVLIARSSTAPARTSPRE